MDDEDDAKVYDELVDFEATKFDLKEIYIENNSLLNADDIKKQLISIYGKNLIFLNIILYLIYS